MVSGKAGFLLQLADCRDRQKRVDFGSTAVGGLASARKRVGQRYGCLSKIKVVFVP